MMVIYTASILFWCGNETMDFPYMMTSYTCSGMDAFMERIELELRQNPNFLSANVSINAIASNVAQDGDLTVIDKRIKRFPNLNLHLERIKQ